MTGSEVEHVGTAEWRFPELFIGRRQEIKFAETLSRVPLSSVPVPLPGLFVGSHSESLPRRMSVGHEWN